MDLNNSNLEIKLKITLENANDLPGGDSMGPLNAIINALFKSMERELGGILVTTGIQNSHIEPSSKIETIITSSFQILGLWPRVEKRICRPTVK